MAGEDGGFSDRIALVMSLRKQGIRNIDVLSAMELVPREMFVHPSFVDQAYYDMALPIDCGQTISQPYVVAYMTEQLMVGKGDKVLEIGTGSGYQAAVLSHLARRVFTIEVHKDLQLQAQERFRQLGLDNIHTRCGDGREGWPEQASFDRIIVTAAAAEVPPPLLEQLALGGRLVMPVGDTRETQLIAVIERTDRGYEQEQALPVRFVPLVHPAAVAKSSHNN
jgi:protein-L-isoaspartate(D-aspartate) O-methyltransferase